MTTAMTAATSALKVNFAVHVPSRVTPSSASGAAVPLPTLWATFQ